jgi:ADP-ribose pyrophosphatase YjhB (NUDIX family)
MIDEGESCRECAVRELFEETNQKAERICTERKLKHG